MAAVKHLLYGMQFQVMDSDGETLLPVTLETATHTANPENADVTDLMSGHREYIRAIVGDTFTLEFFDTEDPNDNGAKGPGQQRLWALSRLMGAAATGLFTVTTPGLHQYTFSGLVKMDLIAGGNRVNGQKVRAEITLTTDFSESSVYLVATPTATPAAGNYGSAQTVTLACATPDSDIYYTTNGTDPTWGSTKYTTTIHVAAPTTIKAVATAAGMGNSKMLTAVYTGALA